MKYAAWIFAGVLLVSTAARADEQSPLSIEDYVGQVKKANLAVQGSTLNSAGAKERAVEGELAYSPRFFSNVQHADDRRPAPAPAFTGDRTLTDSASIGVSKQTAYGLEAAISYDVARTSVHGTDPRFVPESDLTAAGLSLQFTQPLLRNGFGASTRAGEQAIRARAQSTAYGEAYNVTRIVADAEARYWRLAALRAAVQVDKEQVEGALRFRDFYAKQERRNLVDRAELLQSEANLKQWQLALRNAQNDERTAMRAFNEARHVDSDHVGESLALPGPEELGSLAVPARTAQRDDVKAAEQNMLATAADSEVARQNQLPQLDIYGGLSTNGLDPNVRDSMDGSFTSRNPAGFIGMRFSIPLDFTNTSRVRAGYLKAKEGARRSYEEKAFEQETGWNDLVKRFSEAKELLSMSVDLVSAQKAKLESEQKRLKQGHSTTYQVFLFEQDYLNARLGLIQTQGMILTLLAQMKTWQGGTL